MNTKQRGSATVIIYPCKGRYIGVCLELDLVDEGKDLEEVTERLRKSVRSYVEYVHAKGHGNDLLNRPAPLKYWKKYFDLVEKERDIVAKAKQSILKHAPSSTKMAERDTFAVYREPFERQPA